MDHRTRFEAFADLHRRPEPLLIGNAWDVATALVMEPFVGAIGISSASAAAALGYLDDESLPFSMLRDLAARVVAMVRLPVSVDVQAGFSTDPEECARNVVGLANVGVVGINLEDRSSSDGLVPASHHVQKIRAIRAATEAGGTPVFINARTDAFEYSAPDAALPDAIERAGHYVDAGAHGIFVPFTNDMSIIQQLAARIRAPLNILVGSPGLRVSDLREAGVRRLSFGSSPMLCAMAEIKGYYEAVTTTGRASHLARERMSYADLQRMLEERDPRRAVS